MERMLTKLKEMKPHHWYVLCKYHFDKASQQKLGMGYVEPSLEVVGSMCDVDGCDKTPEYEFSPSFNKDSNANR